jgi:hypothetical protein
MHRDAAIRLRFQSRPGLQCARLPDRSRFQRRGHQCAGVGGGKTDQLAVFVEQRGFLQAGGFAQIVEAACLNHCRQVAKLARQDLALAHHFALDMVQRRASQRQTALQRTFHAYVEPGFDGADQELNRNAIDHHARHQRHQTDDQEHACGEFGAEHAGPDAAHQHEPLIRDQQDQAGGCHHRQDQQQRQMAGKEFGIVRRRGKQPDQGGPEQEAGSDQVDHGMRRAGGKRQLTGRLPGTLLLAPRTCVIST